MPGERTARTAVLAATLTNHATEVEAVLAAPTGEIILRRSHSVRLPLGPNEMLTQITVLAGALCHPSAGVEYQIIGVVVALDAVLDAEHGVVLDLPPVAGWEDFPLVARLNSAFGAPTQITTFPNAALLAEILFGAGRGVQTAAYLDLSRQINAALFLQQRLVHRPFVGALGHVPVVADAVGERCACGGRGHLATVASAQALVRRMIGALVEYPATEAAVMAITGGRAESLTVQQIWQLACDGDTVAQAVMDDALNALAVTLVFLFVTLDVERVILGGTLARCGPDWLEVLRERVMRRAPPRRAIEFATRLTLAELGPAAVIRGTIAMARQVAGQTLFPIEVV